MTDGRREQIVEAARAILVEDGLEAVSVRSVARRAGIGASTLRHYFPTQGDLYDVLLRPAVERSLLDLNIHDRRVAPRTRLTDCLLQYFPEELLRPETVSLWFAMYAAAVGPAATPHGTTTLNRMSKLSRERVRAWLTELEEEGALAVELDLAVLLVLTTLDGIWVQLIAPEPVFGAADVRPVLELAITAVVRA